MGAKEKLDLDVDVDLDLDLNLEEIYKDKTGIEKENPWNSDLDFEESKTRVKEEYKGGFGRYKNEVLNTTYHTMILVFHVYVGYFISSIRYEGFNAWKTKQSIYFYIIFAIGYGVLTLFEYLRYKEENNVEKEGN